MTCESCSCIGKNKQTNKKLHRRKKTHNNNKKTNKASKQARISSSFVLFMTKLMHIVVGHSKFYTDTLERRRKHPGRLNLPEKKLPFSAANQKLYGKQNKTSN